ncbi:hypothetical protein CoNPh26_CDS0042 [Staphylococcus phage S-CoN_Ph26]|nr:hypothetical protein CoNPh26_CDS0042 [Staphylococcus phage S-CoN_Ph26]
MIKIFLVIGLNVTALFDNSVIDSQILLISL